LADTHLKSLPGEAEPADLKAGSIFFVGTATVILRYAGFTILTDPNFLHSGEKVPLGYGMHSTRLTDPAINIEDLPPLDLVILSHYHGDHFDPLVEKKLDKNLLIVTNHGAAKALAAKGFNNTVALQTWETFTVTRSNITLKITAMPGRHGPGLLTVALPPVMGSMLEFEQDDKSLLKLYITGDTLLYEDLREIPERYPDIDLALVHLGGTRILGLMLTMDGRQGVEVVKIMQPKTAIPIHYNDYPVFKSPLEDFKKRVKAAGLELRVHYLSHGETFNFSVPVA
jgi:L-ascorbate metabolism protein UlaG (beta-lactamase superfamily)